MLRCPACKTGLLTLEFQEVEVDFCPACQGCWLDQGELGLILHGAPDLPPGWDLSLQSAGARPCPHCGRKMKTGPLPSTKVEVDACPLHGLWLDAGELQALVRAAAGPTSALAAHCDAIFRQTTTTNNGGK